MALNLRKGDIGLKWFKIFYLQSSCVANTYVLISKSQLNNDVNSKENFQKMWISSSMFYLKFFCGRHTNPGLGILPELCRSVYQVSEFLQSSLLRESTKHGRLNFRVSLWKRKSKDFETRSSLYDIFSHIKKPTQQTKTNDWFSKQSIAEYRFCKIQILVHFFLTLMWLIFCINMKTVRLKITLKIQLPVPVPLTFPLLTPNLRLPWPNFLTSSIMSLSGKISLIT